ncbi:MAG: hypothetical protein HY905_18650 [Deltaproteobacteria bacterium]|nr:hypothetical protein [Deltaproteobacteria bacterium]
MVGRLKMMAVVSWCLVAGAACIPEPPSPPPTPEFPEPAQPSLRPADDAEVIASWDFGGCKTDWTVDTAVGTPWTCGPILRGPAGDRTGEGDGWGVGMSAAPAGLTETTLTSASITLDGTNANAFTLSVWHWLDAEALAGRSETGGGLVEVFESNLEGWVAVAPYGGYDGPVVAPGTSIAGEEGFTDARVERVWRRSFFDLSPWAGRTIRVRFRAGLGTLTPGDGWFLDDVQILRGGIVEDVVDTDLSTCGAGAVIRFPFRTCDEGFATQGISSSWACGPATALAAYPEAPVGDGPQFDVDDSGLLFATAPSGLYYPLEASELVSAPMDLSGCQGRTTSLSFWHWYHFGPNAGGWVEVWDGTAWQVVTPLRGYGGPVTAAALRLGSSHDGFISPDDQGSGWRFEVFDVSPYANPAFRVRFRFFAGLQRRPGWYVDTVAVSTFALEDVPRLDGDPSKPACGFDANTYQQPAFGSRVPDPCVAGTPVVPWTTVFVQPDQPAPKTSAGGSEIAVDPGPSGAESSERSGFPETIATTTVVFDVPGSGAVCIEIRNGSRDPTTRVGAGTAALDGQLVIGSDRLTSSATLLRERQAVGGGPHKLVIDVQQANPPNVIGSKPGAGSAERYFSYQVLYQAGNALPRRLPGSGPGTIANFSTARWRDLRVGKFELNTTLPAIGEPGQDYVVPYVLQIADPDTCRQVRQISGIFAVPAETRRGIEEAIGTAGFAWDGRDDDGHPVQGDRVVVRLFATAGMSGQDVVPLPGPMELHWGSLPFPFNPNLGPPGGDPTLITVPATVLAWARFYLRPRVDGIATVGACTIGGVGVPSCAPNAQWLSTSPGRGSFEETGRVMRLTGYFLPADTTRSYEVDFAQGSAAWMAPVTSTGASWWIEARMPVLGDGRPAGTSNPDAWDPMASVSVLYGGTEMSGGARSFTFRGPSFTGIDPEGDGEWFPGDGMTLWGELFATYRMNFLIRQDGVVSGRYSGFQADEVEYGLALPGGRDLRPGTAYAEVMEVAPEGDPVHGARSWPFTVAGPEITAISPGSGRICPTVRLTPAPESPSALRHVCRRYNEGLPRDDVAAQEFCVTGHDLRVDGWGTPSILFERDDGARDFMYGPVVAPGTPTTWTEWTDTRLCFFVSDALRIVRLNARMGVAVVYPHGPANCTASHGCYITITGRGGPGGGIDLDHWVTGDGDATEITCHPEGLPVGMRGTITLSSDRHGCSSPGTDLYKCPFTISYDDTWGDPEVHRSLEPAAPSNVYEVFGTVLPPTGFGGVAISGHEVYPDFYEGDCRVLAIISHRSGSPGSETYHMWLYKNLSPDFSEPFTPVADSSVMQFPQWVGTTPPYERFDLIRVESFFGGSVAIASLPQAGTLGAHLIHFWVWDTYNGISYANPSSGNPYWEEVAPETFYIDHRAQLLSIAGGYTPNGIASLQFRFESDETVVARDFPVWFMPPDPPPPSP